MKIGIGRLNFAVIFFLLGIFASLVIQGPRPDSEISNSDPKFTNAVVFFDKNGQSRIVDGIRIEYDTNNLPSLHAP